MAPGCPRSDQNGEILRNSYYRPSLLWVFSNVNSSSPRSNSPQFLRVTLHQFQLHFFLVLEHLANFCCKYFIPNPIATSIEFHISFHEAEIPLFGTKAIATRFFSLLSVVQASGSPAATWIPNNPLWFWNVDLELCYFTQHRLLRQSETPSLGPCPMSPAGNEAMSKYTKGSGFCHFRAQNRRKNSSRNSSQPWAIRQFLVAASTSREKILVASWLQEYLVAVAPCCAMTASFYLESTWCLQCFASCWSPVEILLGTCAIYWASVHQNDDAVENHCKQTDFWRSVCNTHNALALSKLPESSPKNV